MKHTIKPRLSLTDFTEGILKGDRIVLGQAITLVESKRKEDQDQASRLLENVLTHTGKSLRIGLTGVPGVGKSTFIEAFGKHITGKGLKLAVLTIDPSSPVTGGSILGDKTRMDELSKDPMAFIRPTAASHALGGVAHKTREAMLLCEAAGFEVILVETVGVGQSEIAVKNMVDFFLLLVLTGAGDELQGIKKGIIEIADALVVTKADGDNVTKSLETQAMYQEALHLFAAPPSGWQTRVLTSSAFTGEGIEEVYNTIMEYRQAATVNGFFAANRRQQNVSWFREYFSQLLNSDIEHHAAVRTLRETLEAGVTNLTLSSHAAAAELLEAYHQAIRGIRS